MPAPKFPRARRADLLVQDAQNELVIYDTKTDKAYVLNPSAAAVWHACNGQRTVRDIAQYLSHTTPTDEQTVQYALGQLQDLLDHPDDTPREFLKMSRRDFLKRAGIVATAAAIPVVVKIVAPTPAHAASDAGCCQCQNHSLDFNIPSCADCSSYCTGQGSTYFTCQVGNTCPV